MKVTSVFFCMVLGTLLVSGEASAKGCLKGAAVGGVAGHVAGKHGLIGAGVGCAIGRHRANKADREAAAGSSANVSKTATTSTASMKPVPQPAK